MNEVHAFLDQVCDHIDAEDWIGLQSELERGVGGVLGAFRLGVCIALAMEKIDLPRASLRPRSPN